MPIISWFLLTLGEMIFHIDIFMFHMNMLPLLLVAFTIVCVFLVLDLPAFFIKKDTPPFNTIIKEKITHTPEVVLLCLTFLWMLIASFFADNFRTLRFFFPYTESSAAERAFSSVTVLNRDFGESGVTLTARVAKKDYPKLRKWVLRSK